MNEQSRDIGVVGYLRRLPRRHGQLFVITGAGSILATGLDAVSLALVAPVIALLAGSEQDLANSDVVNWTRTLFGWFDLEFRLRWLILIVIFITVVRSLLLLFQSWITALYLTRHEAELRDRGYRAIMLSSWPFFLRQRAGNLMNMLLDESSRSGGVLGTLNNGVISLLNLLTYLVFALLISWELTLATAAATTVLVLLYGVLTKYAKRLGRRLSAVSNQMVSEMNEGMAGAKIFKSEALEDVTTGRFRSVVYERARVQKLAALMNGLFVSTAEVMFIGMLLGGLVLGTRVFDLPSTTVLVFALLFFRIYQRTRAFQSTILTASGSLPAVSIVDNLTTDAEQSVEPEGRVKFSSLASGIEFQDVVFQYDDNEPVLDGVSFSIPTGTTTALVGPSGMGKTTVIDLTIGLLHPTRGSVLVDGIPLEEYSRDSWRSNLAYVSQETILFHDTVFRNIAWGKDEATQEEVYEAARLADADPFIQTLSSGYETIIGDRGMRLSGGQRQRLALARAILRKPDLLILDEATSELDSEAEARIQETFESVRQQTTVLMAAHRLSTILSADQICVLGDGAIVEAGTAEELLANRGVFSALYERFIAGEAEDPGDPTRA